MQATATGIQGKIDLPEHRKVLEEAGAISVRYYHKKWGNMTDAVLLFPDKLVGGRALCHPRDQYCRRTGRIVALRNAIHGLDLKQRRG